MTEGGSMSVTDTYEDAGDGLVTGVMREITIDGVVHRSALRFRAPVLEAKAKTYAPMLDEWQSDLMARLGKAPA